MADHVTLADLASDLKSELDEAARLRRPFELEWLRDLRLYKGKYDPEILELLDDGCSKVFIRMGTVKVDNTHARGLDLLFPINGEKNWGISPTPISRVDKAVMAQIYGVDPEDGDALQDAAKEACREMSKAMDDQLQGGGTQSSYRDVCRDVMLHGVLFGTGVLKGPMVEKRSVDRYRPVLDEFGLVVSGEDGGVQWELTTVVDAEYQPQFNFVPLWDIYPDMSALKFSDCRYIWENHLYTKQDLLELGKGKLFDEAVIRAYVNENPNGDAKYEDHESDVRALASGDGPKELAGRFRVRERWGFLTGKQLRATGRYGDLEEDRLMDDFAANVWMVGDKIIKAVVSPMRGAFWPYYAFYFRKDESSIYGEGVASRLRDPQAIINGAARMMLDAAALSSGYIGEVNIDLLEPGEEADLTIRPRRLFKTQKGRSESAGYKAVDITTMASKTGEYMALVEFARNFADDLTLPRFQHGNAQVSGAGKTASGLSMLMAAANIDMKELVKNFDDNITEPFIRALYYWNMQFNPEPKVKGDYDVVAKGSSSLIAKEVQSQQLVMIAQITDNPRFAPLIKDDELLRGIARSSEVTASLVRDDEEQAQFQAEQLLMQARANLKALVEQFEAQGGDKNALLERIANAMIQQVAQLQGPGGEYAQAN